MESQTKVENEMVGTGLNFLGILAFIFLKATFRPPDCKDLGGQLQNLPNQGCASL